MFGAVRGFLLAVVAFAIFNWLVGDKQQPEWVQNAKTRPMLIQTADRIIAMLPEDAATTLESWIKSKTAPNGADVPADEGDAAPPTPPSRAQARRRNPPIPPIATSSTRSSTVRSRGRRPRDLAVDERVELVAIGGIGSSAAGA